MSKLKSLVFIVVFLQAAINVFGETYYVSQKHGSNSADGKSLNSAFESIQKAADVVEAGDTVYITTGVYREEVQVKTSGLKGQPIVFMAYQDDDVSVTTTEYITSWEAHSDHIFKAKFESNKITRAEMTVFENGKWINEANWTDKNKHADLLRRTTYSTYNDATYNTIKDNDLVGKGADFCDDVLVRVQSNYWQFSTQSVKKFDSNTGTITFNKNMMYDPSKNFIYTLFNSLKFLDTDGEWYYDSETKELYIWRDNNELPTDTCVEAKKRYECFVTNDHDHIQFVGIDMYGGDIRLGSSSHILLQGAHIEIPDRTLGVTSNYNIESLVLKGDSITVRDCEFENIWKGAMKVKGANCQIINNYVHEADHVGTHGGAFVNLSNSKDGTLISHNTVTNIGRGAIGGTGYHFVVQYNDFSHSALLSEDVGVLAFGNQSYNNSIIHHNVFHDIYGHCNTGIYVDNYGSSLIVHNNITYNVPHSGMQFNLPASFMLVYNNTCFNSGGIFAWTPASYDASGCRFVNNICSSISTKFLSGGSFVGNNYKTSSASNFTDPSNGDFTLKSSSGAINYGVEIPNVTTNSSDGKPDAGALEFGEKMWDYGHDFENPPYPEYTWYPVPYTNKIENSGFELGLAPWTRVSGKPQQIKSNAWNYKDDALGVTASYALELPSGSAVEQKISGLIPNTNYKFLVKTRLIREDIQVEAYSKSSGSFNSGSYRGELYLKGFNAGEWLCYPSIDFGEDKALFSNIAIGNEGSGELNVSIHIDAIDGPQLTTLMLEGGGRWYITSDKIPNITGTHDLYLVFKNSASDIGIDRIRLYQTNIKDKVEMSISGLYDGDSTISKSVGEENWTEDRGFAFKTGPNDTSVVVALANTNTYLTAYADDITLVETDQAAAPNGAHSIPGMLQLEDFDYGESSISYYDKTFGNSWNLYRKDASIDIQRIAGTSDEYSISSIDNGEWVNYTIADIDTGLYDIELRYACKNSYGIPVKVSLGGKELHTFKVNKTGSWDKWKILKASDVRIDAKDGDVLNVLFQRGGLNVDYLNFKKAGETSVPTHQANNKISIYPNPVHDTLVLSISDADNIDRINVYSMQGNLVKTYGKYRNEIDVKDLQQGVYCLQVNLSTGGQYMQRFIKE